MELIRSHTETAVIYFADPNDDELCGVIISHIVRRELNALGPSYHCLFVGDSCSGWTAASDSIKMGRVTACLSDGRLSSVIIRDQLPATESD